MTKVQLAFITHENSDRKNRNNLIFDAMKNMLRIKDRNLEISEKIYSDQPIYMKYGYPLLDKAKFRYWSNRIWFGNNIFLSVLKVILREFMSFGIFITNLSRINREIMICKFVTDKHILAWKTAQQEGIEILIVNEDDSIVSDLFESTLNEGLDLLVSDSPTIINFCSANNFERFKTKSLSIDGYLDWFSLLAMDTTCSYAINSTGIAHLVKAVEENPKATLIGSDLFMSYIFMKRGGFGVFHKKNPGLSNGTIEGNFATQIFSTRVHKSSTL